MKVVWDDKGLQAIFEEIGETFQGTIYQDALKITARKLASIAKADAIAAGYGKARKVETIDGWVYQTYGRIPRSIVVGKLVRQRVTGKLTLRVYNKGSGGFLQKAKHAHLAYLGHKIHLPTKGSRWVTNTGRSTQGKPIYGRALRSAPETFNAAVEKAVAKMVNKINRGAGR